MTRLEAAAISNSQLVNKFSISRIRFPEFRHFTGIATIERNVFNDKSYVDVIIPETVTNVANNAFQLLRNSRIEFLRTTTFTTGDYTFGQCNDTELYFHTSNAPTPTRANPTNNNLIIYAPANSDEQSYQSFARAYAKSYTIHYTL